MLEKPTNDESNAKEEESFVTSEDEGWAIRDASSQSKEPKSTKPDYAQW